MMASKTEITSTKQIDSQRNKEWLYEISFMRPILLTLLVSYHAFAPWCGAWDMPTGCEAYEPYRWIAFLSRAFRLECFVFISGYVFTFQLLSKNKYSRFKDLLTSKIVRLLVPCWIFSVIYFVCFKQYSNLINFLIVILGGAGHLWYLPCLFVCFVVQWFLIKKEFNTCFVIFLLTLFLFVSFIPLPMKMNRPLYYMLFFYGGGLFYQNKKIISEKTDFKKVMGVWCLFLILLIGVNTAIDFLKEFNYQNVIKRDLFYGIKNILKAVLAVVGIYAFYTTGVIWCRKHQVKEWAMKIGVCGYGVYVFHQFVLVWLYEYTQLPQILGTYWLPWIGFFVATVLSLALTLLIHKTRIGRKIL